MREKKTISFAARILRFKKAAFLRANYAPGREFHRRKPYGRRLLRNNPHSTAAIFRQPFQLIPYFGRIVTQR